MSVSLLAPISEEIAEADDETVQITVSAVPTPHTGLLVRLEYSGTATRDHDYSAGADIIAIPANTRAASVPIDIYRDFDAEEDETISVDLVEIRGNGIPGARTRVALTVLDGGGGESDIHDLLPPPSIEELENLFQPSDFVIVPTHYEVTESSVDFGLVALRFPFAVADSTPDRLIVEYSSDLEFGVDLNVLSVVDLPETDPGTQTFFEEHRFSLPLARLAPNESWFVRVYVNEPPPWLFQTGRPPPRNVAVIGGAVVISFATNAAGRVKTWCEAPVRSPAAAADPLLSEQWHLENSGETRLDIEPGVPGADMRMAATMQAGKDGDGAKLAIVDTGLEVCHPDLAANAEPGKSFNFQTASSAGASMFDPFNQGVLGDHGTSVAGVAAAVANNGLGGRGVASGAELRGFNIASGVAGDFMLQMLQSLGGSDSLPDSASADIFNMSFGALLPALNAAPDFRRLLRMGTTDLRSGRGALYVKAAGNAFTGCLPLHVLILEVGCTGSNADPDQNLPYTINVGAFTAGDVKAVYSSAGANLWVVAPAGEDGVFFGPAIITTDQAGVEIGYSREAIDPLNVANHPANADGDYTSLFGGTSAAAPAAAGAIAILIGVNPALTWRDVKHILASTARRIDPDIRRVRAAFNGKPFVLQPAWQTNAAGYAFHNWYGFGAVAVDDAVAMAEAYTPDSLGEFIESPWFDAADAGDLALPIPDRDGGGVTDTLEIFGLPPTANVEAVLLEIRVDHTNTWDLGIELTSPGGSTSVVNTPFNAILGGWPGLFDWRVLSNAFYGEQPNGTWTIRVVDLAENDVGQLNRWRLRIYYGDHP